MANSAFADLMKLAKRGIWDYIAGHPLVVSYEVTLSCNCNCYHCDLGGLREEKKQLKPSDYANITRLLNPVAVQISGGEPLLRKDIVEIVTAIKQSIKPYIILVSNGWLLHKENYLELCRAGVNQFSISLDFPDERHDKFRRRSGLYEHLDKTIPKLAKLGFKNIILNTAITKANLKEIVKIAKKAKEWGVFISYSAYTPLRTGNRDYCPTTKDELEFFKKTIEELMELRRKTHQIIEPKSHFLDILKFFKQGYMPKCKAGVRFLVVMPDGSLIPCSMHRQKFSNQKEMIEKFSRTNQCGGCWVSIRGYSEHAISKIIKDFPNNIGNLFSLISSSKSSKD